MLPVSSALRVVDTLRSQQEQEQILGRQFPQAQYVLDEISKCSPRDRWDAYSVSFSVRRARYACGLPSSSPLVSVSRRDKISHVLRLHHRFVDLYHIPYACSRAYPFQRRHKYLLIAYGSTDHDSGDGNAILSALFGIAEDLSIAS